MKIRQEYAVNDVRNRNHFVTNKEEIAKRDKEFRQSRHECYEGMFAEVEDKGITKYAGELILDLDAEGAAESDSIYSELRDELAHLLKCLAWMLIPLQCVKVEFSGSKGFHVRVPGFCLLFGEQKNLPTLYGMIAEALKTECQHLDTSIYQPRRLIRVANTVNAKTGYYDIEIPKFFATQATRQQMLKFAKAVQPHQPVENEFPDDKKMVIKERVKELLDAYEESQKANEDKIEADEPVSIEMAVDIKPEQGSMSRKEAIAYVNEHVDMRELTGHYEKSFRCIFHDDKKPSASILPPDENHTDWLYYCHSSNCDARNLDNIEVVRRLEGLDFNGALNYLCKIAGISYNQPKNGLEKMKKRCYRAINDSRINKKLLKEIKPLYHRLFDIAIETAKAQNLAWKSDDYITNTSLSYVCEKLGYKDGREDEVCKKLALLSALGFIRKYRDDEVPPSYLSQFFAECEHRHGEDCTPQFWSLIDLSVKENLAYVQQQVKIWLASKGSIRKINYEHIKSIFGPFIANRAYTKPGALRQAKKIQQQRMAA